MERDVLTAAMVREAADRIAPHVHRTPVLRCASLDRLAGSRLALKAENLQRVGAFKARGAFNALLRMGVEARSRGVLAVSSGNHAQAVALAARELGTRAVVVMPADANPVKVEATLAYGAQVVSEGVSADNREEFVRVYADAAGLPLVHPFDDHDVMAGQGTAGLELVSEVPELDAVVVPLGGGGLLSGVAVAVKDVAPRVRVVGVEPEGADDGRRSLEAGELTELGHLPDTIVDGVRSPRVGDRPWEVIRELVDEIVTVSDTRTLEAMELLWTRAKTVVEPAAAMPLAAVLDRKVVGAEVGLLLSGGNVDLDAWARTRRL